MSERVRLDYVAAALAVLALGFAFYKVLTPSPAPVPQAPVVASTPAPTTAPVAIATTPAAPSLPSLAKRLTAVQEQRLLQTYDVIHALANSASGTAASSNLQRCRAASSSGRVPAATTKVCVTQANTGVAASAFAASCTEIKACGRSTRHVAAAFKRARAAMHTYARVIRTSVPAGACRRMLMPRKRELAEAREISDRFERASDLATEGDYLAFQDEMLRLSRYLRTNSAARKPARGATAATVAKVCHLHPAG